MPFERQARTIAAWLIARAAEAGEVLSGQPERCC